MSAAARPSSTRWSPALSTPGRRSSTSIPNRRNTASIRWKTVISGKSCRNTLIKAPMPPIAPSPKSVMRWFACSPSMASSIASYRRPIPTTLSCAHAAVLKKSDAAEGEFEWQFAQKYKAYATDLTLSEDRIDYMQKLNVEFGIQKKVLPFNEVADMSLAKDAVKLLG